MTRWLAVLLLSFAAQAQELSPEQDARYRQLTHELRCLVCQNQNIADSNAPLANDLRDQVKAQILAGRSDAEIKTYLTDRYGDFVLYNPPLTARTVLLWAGPALLALLALTVALLHLRRARRSAKAPAVDAEALRRLLEEQK